MADSIINFNITNSGTGFLKPYGAAEVTMLMRSELVSGFDVERSGRVRTAAGLVVSTTDMVTGGKWTHPSSLSTLGRQAITIGTDGRRILGFNGTYMPMDGPTGLELPASWSVSIVGYSTLDSVNDVLFSTRDLTVPVVIGLFRTATGPDVWKLRVYTRYNATLGSATYADSAATLGVANQYFHVFASYDGAGGLLAAYFNGTQVIAPVAKTAPNHALKEFHLGANRSPGFENVNTLKGALSCVHVTNSASHVVLEPIFRAFAKERFPTALAHVP